ncbi:MAG: sodium/proline symporter [Rubripirellula sp.]|nr:sodium/proline symporter [Rubripirellula sp.]
MESYRAQIIVACVVVYFVLCIVVGLWAMRKTKSARDFFMAGRDLGIFVTSIAIFSSAMSGFGFVGGPGLVYRMGISSLWIVISTTIGYAICFFLLGKKLREWAVKRDSISLPDVIKARYQSTTAGVLAAVAIVLGVMGYLATQIAAMATVLQSLVSGLTAYGEVSLFSCALFSTVLLVFYCVTGGIIASVYTDLIQGVIMMVAAVLVVLTAIWTVDGGLSGISEILVRDDPQSMSPWGSKGMVGCLSWYFVFALGVAGQPHVITKLMMTRRAEDARWTLPATIAGYMVTALLWIVVGLTMRALVVSHAYPELANADSAAPDFLQYFTHPVLAGIVFAGLFAAIMSTADAFLNIGAAAIVHDIPVAVRGKPVENELKWARIVTVLIGVTAMLFALYSREMVALLGAFGWGTFAAALVPTVAIGLNWKRATSSAACVAIASSLIVNFSIRAFNFNVPLNIDSGAVALLVSLVLFIGVSLVTSNKPDVAEH